MSEREPLDFDAIEARANHATPGPWRPRASNATRFDIANDYAIASDALPSVPDKCLPLIGEVWAEQVKGSPDGRQSRANAEFICNARTDIPALIAEVRRLREALNEALFYVTAGGPARMFGTREMYDCLIEKSRVDGWRSVVGGEPR